MKIDQNFMNYFLLFKDISFIGLYILLALIVTGCNDSDSIINNSNKPMVVSIQFNTDNLSRGIIDGGYLPDGSTIGVSLFDAVDGGNYNNQQYYNLCYTADGSNNTQIWSSANPASLSITEGKAIAYYPWSDDENLDLTKVPVETASQTDYMYSKWISGLSMVSPDATFTMQHALTNIRLVLIKGTYTGDCTLQTATVTSPFFGTEAFMDVTTGAINDVIGTGADLISLIPENTVITPEGTQIDIITIADEAVQSGTLTITLQVGNNMYNTILKINEAYINGNAYQYNLTLNNTGLILTDATLNPWVDIDIYDITDSGDAPE